MRRGCLPAFSVAGVGAWSARVYGKFPAVRNFRPSTRPVGFLLVIALTLALSWITKRNGRDMPPVSQEQQETTGTAPLPGPEAPDKPTRADFDFYLLALTSHPA